MAVGIAACSNEHLQILRGLTRMLGNDELCSTLAKTENPQDVIDAINSPSREPELISEQRVPERVDSNSPFALKAMASGSVCPAPEKGMLSRVFTIFNSNGMHARPGKVFVSTIKPLSPG